MPKLMSAADAGEQAQIDADAARVMLDEATSWDTRTAQGRGWLCLARNNPEAPGLGRSMSDPTPQDFADDLSRRAVNCPRFSWLPGMLDQYGRRLCEHEGELRWVSEFNGAGKAYTWHYLPPILSKAAEDYPLPRPDLDDVATLGCFERGLLPAAYGCAPGDFSIWEDGFGVWWFRLGRSRGAREIVAPGTMTLVEALVAVLEAAPDAP